MKNDGVIKNNSVIKNCKLAQPQQENSMKDPQKIQIRTVYNTPITPILHLGIYPKKSKAVIWKDTCIPMFITAVFTIVNKWKQPKCPLIHNWVKVLYILGLPRKYPTMYCEKQRHLLKKIQETLYMGQWRLSPLQSRHLGTSHSSPNHRQLPGHIFLNLINNLLPFNKKFYCFLSIIF